MAFNDNSDFKAAMNSAAAGANGAQPCGEWEEFIILLASGEDCPAEMHSEWIWHAAACEACAGAMAREREMLSLLSEHRSEPDAMLLAGFRASLDDAIDREEEHGWLRRAFALVFPASWLASGPAWSAAALLLVGFSSGLLLGPRVLRRPAAPVSSGGQRSAGLAMASPGDPVSSNADVPGALSTIDLHDANVAGISVLPSDGDSAPQVQLQMNSQRPFTLEGTVDDDDVKSVLINILNSGERFCPDIRLDAVDALSGKTDDPQVRTALCHAVHKDKNAAVRLKALEALNGAEPQDTVQQTLLDALVDDQNTGVRVEAITALNRMAAAGQVTSSDKMVSVLQDLLQNDPNPYIRMQSAAAIRDLGPRGKY
jgi:hypothetical protein